VFECVFAQILQGRPANEAVVKEQLEKLEKILDVYEAQLTITSTWQAISSAWLILFTFLSPITSSMLPRRASSSPPVHLLTRSGYDLLS
jgi:hypothetical protein